MRIFKILNNNVAVILNEEGQEQIVMGRGICFKKRAGDEIPDDMIDKEFHLSTPEAHNKFRELIQDISMEHIVLGEEIIAEAKKRLGRRLNDMIYISLIDHVHTSILRFLDGITVKNVLLWDIQKFYKDEYHIGLWALDLIEKQCKVRLPDDEAGFIALHLANAQMDEEVMHDMYEITKIMQELINIVKYYFHVDFDEEDVYYYRFITHLKFFAKRLLDHKFYEEDDSDELWNIIRKKYQESFQCVGRISEFIQKKYGHSLSKEEQIYLTIHIERVIKKTGK